MDPDATSLHQAVDAPADAPAAPAGTICPNCQTANVPDALFCESCGYDFTTGSLPRPVAPPPTAAPPSVDANTAPPLAEAWVAEVWIDPDWYADQQSTDPLAVARPPGRRTAPAHVGADRPGLAIARDHARHRPVHRQRRQPTSRPAHDRRQPLVGRGPRLLQRHLRRRAPWARSRRPRSRPARRRRSRPTGGCTSAPGPGSRFGGPLRARWSEGCWVAGSLRWPGWGGRGGGIPKVSTEFVGHQGRKRTSVRLPNLF